MIVLQFLKIYAVLHAQHFMKYMLPLTSDVWISQCTQFRELSRMIPYIGGFV